MLRQIRISARTLLRATSFSSAVVLTLAVAIGATTAVFSVVRGVLLAPLPFHAPDELVRIFNTNAPGHPMGGVSAPEYRDDYSGLKTAPHVAAWGSGGANLTTAT